MDLGAEYCYAGMPPWLGTGYSQEGCLDVTLSLVLIACCPPNQCILTEGRAERFDQAGDDACQVETGQPR